MAVYISVACKTCINWRVPVVVRDTDGNLEVTGMFGFAESRDSWFLARFFHMIIEGTLDDVLLER